MDHRLRSLVVVGLTSMLSACVAASALPVCDGRAKQPANPYGSILVPAPTGEAPGAAALEPAPPPAGGCGGGRP